MTPGEVISITTPTDFSSIQCCECGVFFFVPIHFENTLRNSGNTFSCPNGHKQHYIGSKKEIQDLQVRIVKLNDEVAVLKKRNLHLEGLEYNTDQLRISLNKKTQEARALRKQIDLMKKSPADNTVINAFKKANNDLIKENEGLEQKLSDAMKKEVTNQSDARLLKANKDLNDQVDTSRQALRDTRDALVIMNKDFKEFKNGKIKEKPKYTELSEGDQILKEIRESQKKPYEFGK